MLKLFAFGIKFSLASIAKCELPKIIVLLEPQRFVKIISETGLDVDWWLDQTIRVFSLVFYNAYSR